MLDLPPLCYPDCPVASQCLHAPAKTCELEKDFMKIAKEWTETLPESPVTRFRVEALLYPLFQQFFRLQLAQEASGKPIKDLKYVISALDSVINSIRSSKQK